MRGNLGPSRRDEFQGRDACSLRWRAERRKGSRETRVRGTEPAISGRQNLVMRRV